MDEKIFRKSLKEKRLRAGLTQTDVAGFIGASGQDVVAMWELGRFLPSRKFMGKILSFLSMKPEALFFYKEKRGSASKRG